MAKLDKLTALEVTRKTRAGRYGDGGGLWLQIAPTGAKSWLFRYTFDGKERQKGLGALHAVSLSDARDKARECRRLLAANVDPIKHGEEQIAAERLAESRAMTFKACAKSYIAAHEPGWKNEKHAQQWGNTLETYVYPVMGDIAVQSVDTALVTKVLDPIWHEKTETANRVRGRIELVLDWATARENRQGENPARWRGHLDKVYPPKSRLQPTEHHEALPIDEVSAFVHDLREREGLTALAFEFMILTVKRTVEVLGAKWGEIDTRQKVWTIPAVRMKGKKGARVDHRVPLSPRALAILEEVRPLRRKDDYIFPGDKEGKPLSNMVFLMLRDRMGRQDDFTPHGFRSTFRDWAAERTSFPREVAEKALAHAVRDKTEAAYQRNDLLERRRPMMDDWAKHCTAKRRGDVVPFGRRRA